MDYEAFLKTKGKRFNGMGFECDESRLPSSMFAWQKKIVAWATKKGRCALWADTGLGKTIMQLAWADQVRQHTGKPVMILTPLAVSAQTVKEAEKFGLDATVMHESEDACLVSLGVTNYHKLHKFDPTMYGGVVLDESSILKSFQGKTKTLLTEAFSLTPYRLACTATPAPNDHLELGNHSDFLGIMPQKEMLARWFLNDLMGNMSWRLKGHAKADFWRWVASWALVLRSPADLGYDSIGYDLPKLNIHHVTIPTTGIHLDGALFADASLSATTLHSVLRQTAPIRAKKAAAIIDAMPDDDWLVWTHTNYEADELIKVMPDDAIEVRGSDSVEFKEASALWMSGLQIKRPSRTIGKPCKKITLSSTTEITESAESQSQPNGNVPTETDGAPICANMSSETGTKLSPSVELSHQREIRGGENSTSQMNPSDGRQENLRGHGKKRIQKNDSHNALPHMESHLKITDPFFQSKKVDARSAVLPNAEIIPNALKAASAGFMSITATRRGQSEACCAQTAISDSESSGIRSHLSSEPSSTSRRILISKSEIFGFGMNFQRCNKMIFVGMDYSYEKFYQAVRRCWRYGQTQPVDVYLLCTDMEWRLFDALAKKQAAHKEMQDEMIAMMKEEYAELTCAR